MSFTLLKIEPEYDHISESYYWTFYNHLRLRQNLLLNGSVKYSYSVAFNKHESLFTTVAKEPTEDEFKKLSSKIARKIWFYLSEEANKANLNFNTFNKYAIDLEKKGWIENGDV